jgi:hypothetical protein
MGASGPICSRSSAIGPFSTREKPDLTLHALPAELAKECAVVIACDTIWSF